MPSFNLNDALLKCTGSDNMSKKIIFVYQISPIFYIGLDSPMLSYMA